MVKGSGKDWLILRVCGAIALVWIFIAGAGAAKQNTDVQNGLDNVMAGQLVRSFLCSCVAK